MAISKVEIFGGQLDGAVLENAASEATLRELLAAIKKLDKSVESAARGGPGASAANQSGAGAAGAALSSGGILGKAMDGVANQIGNVIGVAGSFAGMLIAGETKLSKYTQVLNNQIIKELPLVGKYLGFFGDGITYAIGVFEEWNDFLRESSKTGASFNNSIIEMRQAANSAYLDLDEMVSIIRKHNKNLPAFGGTVTSGIKLLSLYSETLIEEGGLARDTLLQMGYNTKDVNEALASYMSTTMKSGMRQMKSANEVASSFIAYQLHVDKLTKLTGKNAEQIEQEVAATKQDAAYQLKMNMLGEDERAKMDLALKEFTARYGDAGRQLFQSLFFGLAPQTEAGQNLAVQMPHLINEMQRTISSAKNTAMNVNSFAEALDNTMIDSILNAAREYKSAESFISAMSAGTPGLSDLYSSITPILSQLTNYGDVSKLSREQLLQMYKNAKTEQGARDGVTKTVNDINLAFKEMKKNFLDALLPGLQSLSDSLKGQNLGEKFRQLGEDLGTLVTRYMPAAIKFFEYMGSENGRTYFFNEIKYFFNAMGIYLDYGFKQIFTPKFLEGLLGLDDKDRDKDLEALAAEHKRIQDELGVKPLSTYVLPAPDKKTEGPKDEKKPAATYDIPGQAGQRISQHKDIFSTTYGNFDQFDKLDENFQRQIIAAAKQYHASTGKKFQLTDGFRTREQQAAAYRAKPGLAAPPGYSKHEKGLALDASSEALNWLANNINPATGKSYLESFGLHRPVLHKGETWHVEPIPRKNTGDTKKYFGGTMSSGNLFQDFGKGTSAELHNIEAVMTPDQMNTMMKSSQPDSNFSDAVSSLNTNIQQLISLTKQRMMLNERQLTTVERLSGNLFA